MTPLEALQRLRRDGEIVPLLLCQTCRQALLAALSRLFPPHVPEMMMTLEGSHVMGCTFRDGPVGQCDLHALVQEKADATPDQTPH